MSKVLLITLAVAAGVAVFGIAWAKNNGYCSGGDYLRHVTQRVSRKLELNDEQTEKLEGLAETLRRLRGDGSDRRTLIREELERLLTAPTLDRNRVIALLDERHQTMGEHKGEIVDAFADFSDSLSPEQRTRLAELIAERIERRWGHPGWAH